MIPKIRHKPTEEEEALVSALVYLHRRKQQRLQPASAQTQVLEHFQQRARRLREERLLTDELLERLFQDGKRLPPQAPRQELVLRGVAGGVASGRVSVRNASLAEAEFELVVGLPPDSDRRVDVECQPRAGSLAAGASRLIRISADLRELAADETVTLPLECRWRFGRDYLWLTVQAERARP